MSTLVVVRRYPGGPADSSIAFQRERAVAVAHGWRPAAITRDDDDLVVTYRQGIPAAEASVGVHELWKPFVYGSLLAALILLVWAAVISSGSA